MDDVPPSMGEIIGLATDKVNLGRQLMSHLKDLLQIEGVQRIQKQISSEVNTLLIVSVQDESLVHFLLIDTYSSHPRPSTRARSQLSSSSPRNCSIWSVSSRFF